MNPWALLAILLGIVLIIIGIKGTQHNIAGVITGGSGQQSPTTPTKPPLHLPGLPPPPTIGPGKERTVPPVSPM
jgi:hypothetical protein